MIRNATELVILISNTLGWAPPIDDPRPHYKTTSIEAGKLIKGIAKNPKLYTWDNLELAVAYMQRQRITPKSPSYVLHYVEKALAVAYQPDDRPLSDKVQEAITYERAQQLPGWEEWVQRFSRAFGDYRQEIYDDWRKARAAS